LYFGDYDSKGLEISNNALKDIQAWCNVSFQFIRCGINKEHIHTFQLPEQPDKPGAYQWEALRPYKEQRERIRVEEAKKAVGTYVPIQTHASSPAAQPP